MKTILSILLIFNLFISLSQNKTDYLIENRFDLTKDNFKFPQNDFKIIGFGAYHGSSKTYDAELLIFKNLIYQNLLDFYAPEINYSQAYYFNEYLKNGDEKLLKDLVLSFQKIVVQEGTIETFNHWKNIKKINDSLNSKDKIKIIGFDMIFDYKYPIKLLLELTDKIQNCSSRDSLQKLIGNDDLNFGTFNPTIQNSIKNFVDDFNKKKSDFIQSINDTVIFNHLIKNLEYTFQPQLNREKIIYSNFVDLNSIFNLKSKKLFFKYGFSHILKAKENNSTSFFSLLIENQNYSKNDIITIMGYLTKSSVLWDKKYDKDGNYSKFTTKKGFGIGDYWREYFKGIENLKETTISDLTLFRLNMENSPFKEGTDLIEIKMFLKESNSKTLKEKRTTDFIDYAILISNSYNQTPIEELENR